MKEPTRIAARTTATVVLTLLSATLVFLFTLYVHLKIYAVLHPGEITEVDHNTNLESSITVLFTVGYPLLLLLFGWLYWRLTRNWFGRANQPLNARPRVKHAAH